METTTGKARLLFASVETTTGKARLLFAPVETTTGKAHLLFAPVETTTGKAHLLFAPVETTTGKARLLFASVEAAAGQLVTGVHRFVLHLRFLLGVVGVDADHFCGCHKAKSSVLCDRWAWHPGLGARPAEVYLSA